MTQHFDFGSGRLDLEALTYAYPVIHAETPRFILREGWVENAPCPQLHQKFDLVSLLTRRTYGPGTRLSTTCSFDAFGAPLLVITPQLRTDREGELRYTDYYEIVLWESGINIWELHTQGDKHSIRSILRAPFPVSAGQFHSFTAELGADYLQVTVDGGTPICLHLPLWEHFHLGVCACEGINRFAGMTLEEGLTPTTGCRTGTPRYIL